MAALIFANNGSKIYIGTTAVCATTSAYAADTWAEIGGASEIGDYGDTANEIKIDIISDGRTHKAKGTFDAGTMTLKCAYNSADTGQVALIAAVADPKGYNFKVVGNDKITPTTGTNSISYFNAKVMSKAIGRGTANNIVMLNSSLAIDSSVLNVAAT